MTIRWRLVAGTVVAAIILANCGTSDLSQPTTTAFPSITSDSANAAALASVAAIVVGTVSQRVRQETATSQTGPPLRFAVWAIDVEEYVVWPQAEPTLTLYVQESYTTENGRAVVPRFPFTIAPGQRAVFFLTHDCPVGVAQSGGAYCLDGQVPGMTGPRTIRDGVVEVIRTGERVDESVAKFLERVKTVAMEAKRPTRSP